MISEWSNRITVTLRGVPGYGVGEFEVIQHGQYGTQNAGCTRCVADIKLSVGDDGAVYIRSVEGNIRPKLLNEIIDRVSKSKTLTSKMKITGGFDMEEEE